MKKFMLISITLLWTSLIFSQTIKLANGLSISSMDSKKFSLLNKKIYSYSILAGCDYFEHKYFYLSSEAGYIKTGGKENFSLTMTEYKEIEDYWEYIHLNTSFRIRYSENNSHIYLGFGPKIDFLISSDDFQDEIFHNVGYKMKKIVWGSKIEVGLATDIKKIRVGLNASYLWNFMEVGESDYNKLKSNTYLLLFSIGYIL